jgi:phosphosulfolactate phosphohydrolase-like enzyme
MFLYQQAQKSQIKFFHNSSHSKRLAALGLKKDIKYCFSLDKTKIIPVLQGKYLVKFS